MEFKEIKIVLIKVLFWNWLVAFAKIFIGIFSGSLSILADGLHSFFDGLTNIIGFLGVSLAEKPADKDHPYGHRKYEAIASMLILFFLIIAGWETVKNIYDKLFNPTAVNIEWFVFAVLAGCILIDYLVARYEYKRGVELKSTILKADSSHTKSHYITTGAVLLAAIFIKLGLPSVIDPFLAIFVVGFIVQLGCKIFKETAQVLSDRAFVDENKVKKIVEEMLGPGSCHEIRTRGDENYIFMDLHVVLNPQITLSRAHEICDKLEEKIQAEIPEVKDITVHPEPDKEETAVEKI